MSRRYDLKRSTNQQYYFTLVADNEKTVLVSETYLSKQSALDGIAAVRVNAPYDARYQRLTSQRGLPFFVLRAANSQVLGTSEEYSSRQAMEDTIAVVKSIAPTASVVDKTQVPA